MALSIAEQSHLLSLSNACLWYREVLQQSTEAVYFTKYNVQVLSESISILHSSSFDFISQDLRRNSLNQYS